MFLDNCKKISLEGPKSEIIFNIKTVSGSSVICNAKVPRFQYLILSNFDENRIVLS